MNLEKQWVQHIKSKEQVLIIGGGIAGLTLARSFEIAKIPYLLFEKRSEIEVNPLLDPSNSLKHDPDYRAETGIGLWGPGERIINALGIGEQIRSISQRMSCAGYRTQSGDYCVLCLPYLLGLR